MKPSWGARALICAAVTDDDDDDADGLADETIGEPAALFIAGAPDGFELADRAVGVGACDDDSGEGLVAGAG